MRFIKLFSSSFHPLILLVLVSGISFAETEKCPLEELNEYEYTDIECQFYLGTKAFRNEVYAVAAGHWKFIENSPSIYEGDDLLKSTVISTLNYLTYNGLGVEQDRLKAVSSWKEAVKQGDLEARKHLGIAYEDKKFTDMDFVISLSWYKSILFMHLNKDKLDESDSIIWDEAKQAVGYLESKLDIEQIKKADEMAKKSIN
jgi:hypothetical protein